MYNYTEHKSDRVSEAQKKAGGKTELDGAPHREAVIETAKAH